MTTTTNLGITLLEQAQAQKEVTINEAFTALDALVNNSVADKDLSAPPASPVTGVAYIVAASPTGAWAGKATSITYFDQTWRFITPLNGARMWVADEAAFYRFDGTNWVIQVSGGDMLKSTYDPANIVQQVVGTTAAQTLTNKTISGASNTLTVRAASDITGTLPLANGGTGAVTQQAAINTLAGTQVAGRYLRSDGTNTSLSVIQAADVPTLNQNTTGNAATVTTNANLTGEVTSVGNATTIGNAPVIEKVLTGFTAGAGTVVATDSILAAFQKVVGNIAALGTSVSSVFGRTGAVVAASGDYTTAQVTENTNLYFTNARAIAAPITGYTSAAGTVAATDSIVAAIGKLNGNDATRAPLASPTFTGTVTLPAGQVVNGVTLSTAQGTSNFLRGDGTYAAPAGGGGGTVNSVSVTTANGVSGTVATATTTPAISLTLGAITPTSVAATGTVTGSNLSGTNTGDQTTITGNAGTATALQTARTIAVGGTTGLTATGVSFNGSANISLTLAGTLAVANGGTGVTTSSGSGSNALTTSPIFTTPTINGNVSGTGLVLPADGRLTLTTGTPVTTADVTAATSIFYTPYRGNKVAIYTGSTWFNFTFTQMTLALGTLIAGRPYDVFINHNGGTPILDLLAWTNDTTRATGLVYQDGVLVLSGTPTRRYLGTFYTTATTTTEDSAANRYLWNYYNRVARALQKTDSTASWTYSTTVWRQANGSTANQVNFVIGASEDAVSIALLNSVANSTATARTVFATVGLDNLIGTPFTFAGSGVIGTSSVNLTNIGSGVVAAGRHYLAWLEYGAGADTQTWSGGNARGLMGTLMS